MHQKNWFSFFSTSWKWTDLRLMMSRILNNAFPPDKGYVTWSKVDRTALLSSGCWCTLSTSSSVRIPTSHWVSGASPILLPKSEDLAWSFGCPSAIFTSSDASVFSPLLKDGPWRWSGLNSVSTRAAMILKAHSHPTLLILALVDICTAGKGCQDHRTSPDLQDEHSPTQSISEGS